MTKEYCQKQRKDILHKITKLTKTEHNEIFKILHDYNINFTQNNNGLFFNLSEIDNSVIEKIDHLVNFFILNKKELDEHDKKINDCKNNQFCHFKWNDECGNSNIPLNKKLTTLSDDWQQILQEQKSNEKVSHLVNHLEESMERIHKKKGNLKFINAKKKFARRLLSDKKFDPEIDNYLDYEATVF